MKVVELSGMAERLASLYAADKGKIAELCDTVLDPSGRLLGCVREAHGRLYSDRRLADWDSPKVQKVYRMLCDSDDVSPIEDEHWEGWIARRIVAEIEDCESTETPPE